MTALQRLDPRARSDPFGPAPGSVFVPCASCRAPVLVMAGGRLVEAVADEVPRCEACRRSGARRQPPPASLERA